MAKNKNIKNLDIGYLCVAIILGGLAGIFFGIIINTDLGVSGLIGSITMLLLYIGGSFFSSQP